MQRSKSTPSIAGQFLKDYRKLHKLSQEELAFNLHIEPRTLRAYENGERPLNNINELRRIAEVLGVEPERLGISTSLFVPRTSEQIEETLQHIWLLVEESRVLEARIAIERLAQNLKSQAITEDAQLLTSLAHTYHAAGYIVSEAGRAKESHTSILYYQEMEEIARILKDDTMLNIALTYQGDMYRRLGNIGKATTYLEAARDTTPEADTAARGNGIQLLGRVYLKKGELGNFERAMGEAEELAYTFDPAASSTKGHYSPGTVYEEYARAYADLGQMNKALENLHRAEETLPKTKFWELLLMTAKAMTLIKGNELRSGVQVAIEAAEQSRSGGILRYLERIYVIDQYLAKLEKEIGNIRSPLNEALNGGIVLDF